MRLTFTTKDEVESNTATLETDNINEEQSKFLRLQTARKVYASLFDHTNGSSLGYSERLNGTANEKFGIAKSLSVMPGDTVKMEVYAKYVDNNSSNWTTALAHFLASIASGTAPAGTVVDGAGYPTSTSSFPFPGLLNTSGSTGTGPKAYLNWLIFDRNDNFLDGGYQRMSDVAKEKGQDVAHEKLSASVPITQPGYVYIYLSNEETSPVEVYFDDMMVTHAKSPVIETTDYYPFGFQYNNFTREGSLENRIKFQGQEHITDLDLGWDSFKYRNYMPDIGRFFNIDPLAEKYVYNSPYAFAENKLGMGIELEGLELAAFDAAKVALEFKVRTAGSVAKIQDAGGRLVSGNSGNIPSEVPVSDGDRQMIKITGQVSDAKAVTDGTSEIAKTGVRMGAEGMQTTGDAIETAGIVTAQPEITAAGAAISTTGKVIEMGMDASEGNLQAGDVAYEVGSRAVFGSMSSGAKQAAKAGNLDSKAEGIFQGFVNGWNKLSDWVKEKVDEQ